MTKEKTKKILDTLDKEYGWKRKVFCIMRIGSF